MLTKEEVAARIEQLSETDQLVLSLRAVDELTFTEIAYVLDLELEQVVRLYWHAHARVMENLYD